MNPILITPEFAVSAALDAEMVEALADRGLAALMGVAPDTDGVRESEAIRAQAHRAGIAFTHLPVVVGLITQAQVDAFRRALDAADGPVLAYCHSGLRAALMWALARQDELGRVHVIAKAKEAGFEISAYMDDDEEALLAA